MLKKIIGLTIVTLSFGIAVNAQSQGPAPGPTIRSNPPQIQTPNKQQITEQDKRGTEQSPFVVKTITTPKTQEEVDQSRKEHREKTAIDRALVRYTGILALLTSFLVIATAILGFIGWWQWKQLKYSVDSLITTERAYIFATIEPSAEFDMWKIQLTKKESYGLEAVLYLHNLGKTPAIIKEIAYGGAKLTYPPTTDNLSGIYVNSPLVTFIGSNGKVRENQFMHIINESDLQTIRTTEPNITFYCFGYVKYKTIFGDERTHGFCLELAPAFGKFAVCPDSELNYDT